MFKKELTGKLPQTGRKQSFWCDGGGDRGSRSGRLTKQLRYWGGGVMVVGGYDAGGV